MKLSAVLSLSIGMFGCTPQKPQIGGDGKLCRNPDVWDITDCSVMDDNLYIQEV